MPQVAVIRATNGFKEIRTTTVIDYFASKGLSVKTFFAIDNSGIYSTSLLKFRCNQMLIYKIVRRLAFNISVAVRVSIAQPKIVYCCDFDVLFAGWVSAKLSGATLIYDEYDLIESRRLPRSILRFFRVFENVVFKKIALFFVADVSRQRTVRNQKSTIRRNISNSLLVLSEQSGPSKYETRTLFYGGLLLEDRGIDSAISAILQCEGWNFVLVGRGPMSKKLETLQSPKIRFLGELPHRQMILELQKCHLSLVTYDPSNENNLNTASGKYYEASIMRVPSITAIGTFVDLLREQSKIGYSVSYGSIPDLVKALENFNEFDFSQVDLSGFFGTSLENALAHCDRFVT